MHRLPTMWLLPLISERKLQSSFCPTAKTSCFEANSDTEEDLAAFRVCFFFFCCCCCCVFISIISSIKKVEASALVSEIGQKSNENNNFCEPRRSDDSTDNDVCPSPLVGGIEFEQIKMERKRKAEEDDLMVGWICFGVRLLHRFIGCTDRSHFLAMSSFHFTLNPFAIRKGDQRSDIRWNNSPLFAMPVVVGRADDALLSTL